MGRPEGGRPQRGFGGCEGRVGSRPGRQAGTWDWVRVWTPDQLSCHKKQLTFLSFTFALTMDSIRREQWENFKAVSFGIYPSHFLRFDLTIKIYIFVLLGNECYET